MRDQAIADYHARRRGLTLAHVYGRALVSRFAARRDLLAGSRELARRLSDRKAPS